MAEILNFPDRPERTWKHIAEQLRKGSFERTGSKRVADAVAIRCGDILERCVPVTIVKDANSPEERERQLIEYIHQLAGALIGEVGLMAEEIELQKQSP